MPSPRSEVRTVVRTYCKNLLIRRVKRNADDAARQSRGRWQNRPALAVPEEAAGRGSATIVLTKCHHVALAIRNDQEGGMRQLADPFKNLQSRAVPSRRLGLKTTLRHEQYLERVRVVCNAARV